MMHATRLTAALRGCAAGGLGLSLVGALALAIGMTASDGRLLDLAQTTLLRIQLQSRQDELRAPFGSDDTVIRFDIAMGASAQRIATDLVDASLIADTNLFLDFARVEGYDRRFSAGIYFLKQTQSISEIAALLTDSRRSHIPFRTTGGARIEEVAQQIDSNGLFAFTGADFLAQVWAGAQLPDDFSAWAGLPAGASLEGYLYPDSYQLPPDISAMGLRETLLGAFREGVGDELRDAALEQGLTLHQAVTLASIIEREAVWPEEYASIAGVYRNRLRAGMRLQADPTVQYALHGARGRWWPPISFADFQSVVSPYNTYLVEGLPPGPIASPGRGAMHAAVYPAESDYLFFHAACDGSFYHVFARTYEEHLANAC